ncbi:MAG: glycosyltransferase family 4 protein [Betaproteobacteria bacterium]|nr:glycosyltransferase family 4 protein [Betaproteobacteria bacterium]
MNPEVIITNLHKRYTGVSGTINALLPVQSRHLCIGFVGTDIPGAGLAEIAQPENFIKLSLWQAIQLSRKKLPNGRKRIWHVRRDPEMIIALFLRDVLRFPIHITFTSAAKHRHSWFPRWLISRMDAVIATTPEAAAFVPNTTQVVFHGASLDRFAPPQDKHTIWQQSGLPGRYGIGMFGRIRPSKGTDIFVDAMLRVLPDFPDFTGVICGLCQPSEHAYQQTMLDKIAALGLSDRLVFLGDLPLDDIPKWYRNVTMMVACPRYEPFGITPLEAMASGCAVIASRTGAFEHIVKQGETGLLIPTHDVDALVSALRELLSDPAQAVAMGMHGRERVATHFSIEQEAAGIQSVYAQLQ